MTIIQTPPARLDDESVETGLPHDFCRLIHRGIRYAMFHTTMQAGSVDVGDAEQVDDLLARCADLIDILHVHHHHEDLFAGPMLESVAPELSSLVEAQHVVVDEGIEQTPRSAVGWRCVGARSEQRGTPTPDPRR